MGTARRTFRSRFILGGNRGAGAGGARRGRGPGASTSAGPPGHRRSHRGRTGLYVEYRGTALQRSSSRSPSQTRAVRLSCRGNTESGGTLWAPRWGSRTPSRSSCGPGRRLLSLEDRRPGGAPGRSGVVWPRVPRRDDGYPGGARPYGLRFRAASRPDGPGSALSRALERGGGVVAGNSTTADLRHRARRPRGRSPFFPSLRGRLRREREALAREPRNPGDPRGAWRGVDRRDSAPSQRSNRQGQRAGPRKSHAVSGPPGTAPKR